MTSGSLKMLAFKLTKHKIQDAHALPLMLGKRQDIDKPTKRAIVLDYHAHVSAVRHANVHLGVDWHGKRANVSHRVLCLPMRRLVFAQLFYLRHFAKLYAHNRVNIGQLAQISHCQSWHSGQMARLQQQAVARWGQQWRIQTQNWQINSELARLNHVDLPHWGVSGSLKMPVLAFWHTQKTTFANRVNWGQSTQPPCEYYPIPLPDPDPPRRRPCGDRPDAHRLPLALTRKRTELNSHQVPLPLSCNADFDYVPPLDSYMILNKISAKVGDMPLDPLSFSASADMDGYCWSCNMTLSPDDFNRLLLHKNDLGKEPLIEIEINQDRFAFLAEKDSDNRQFGKSSYTIWGRSQTARLGATYALGQKGLIDDAMYASQIAQEQVAHYGFAVQWDIVDWLIPANTYAVTDKTPIAVIQDLAQAAGGFVYSDPYHAKLYVRPRWRVPAWNVNTSSPALTVPANVIERISGEKVVQRQTHGVFVYGNTVAYDVVRYDGEPRASTLNNVLYTDMVVCEAAGIAALSDTGMHKFETITLPIMHKYGLPMGEMGRVWQFAEPKGTWQAVITGVSVEVNVSNDVPVIKQTLQADRYFGS